MRTTTAFLFYYQNEHAYLPCLLTHISTFGCQQMLGVGQSLLSFVGKRLYKCFTISLTSEYFFLGLATHFFKRFWLFVVPVYKDNHENDDQDDDRARDGEKGNLLVSRQIAEP